MVAASSVRMVEGALDLRPGARLHALAAPPPRAAENRSGASGRFVTHQR
jgi:hypothetical protein